MNSPAISIIIPTYNRANILPRSVQSVLDQTFTNFELIIVDDASTDHTYHVVNSFNDPRIHYIRREANGGEAAARNTGIVQARAPFIAHHDSDDIWLPEKLQKQLELFQSQPDEVGAVYSRFRKIQPGGTSVFPGNWPSQKEGNLFAQLLQSNFIGTPTVITRFECVETVGLFNESLKNVVDWEMWIRLARRYRIKFIDETLVECDYTRQNVSSNIETLIQAREYIFNAFHNDLKEHKSALRKQAVGLAHLYSRIEDLDKARYYYSLALASSPLHPKILAAWMSTFGGIRFHQKTTCKLWKNT